MANAKPTFGGKKATMVFKGVGGGTMSKGGVKTYTGNTMKVPTPKGASNKQTGKK